jgi:hypothetical protein
MARSPVSQSEECRGAAKDGSDPSFHLVLRSRPSEGPCPRTALPRTRSLASLGNTIPIGDGIPRYRVRNPNPLPGTTSLTVPGAEWLAAVVPRHWSRRRPAPPRLQSTLECGESAAESVHGATSLRRVPGTGRAPDAPPLVRCAFHEYEFVPRLSTGVTPMSAARSRKRVLVSKRKGMRQSHAPGRLPQIAATPAPPPLQPT